MNRCFIEVSNLVAEDTYLDLGLKPMKPSTSLLKTVSLSSECPLIANLICKLCHPLLFAFSIESRLIQNIKVAEDAYLDLGP